MAQVRKALDITANIDNNQGEIVLNGEIPDAWTDFLGANATMSNPQGWIANVDRTGQDQLTIRCLRRNGNAVEFVPQGTQVSFLLDLVGTN